MHISEVVDAELSGDCGVDLLLQALMKVSPDLPQRDSLDSLTCATVDCEGLKKMSESEWIISLLQVLTIFVCQIKVHTFIHFSNVKCNFMSLLQVAKIRNLYQLFHIFLVCSFFLTAVKVSGDQHSS